MSEDERLEMLRTATEAHADLKELALRLRRHLTSKAPARRTEKALRTAPEARMGRRSGSTAIEITPLWGSVRAFFLRAAGVLQ